MARSMEGLRALRCEACGKGLGEHEGEGAQEDANTFHACGICSGLLVCSDCVYRGRHAELTGLVNARGSGRSSDSSGRQPGGSQWTGDHAVPPSAVPHAAHHPMFPVELRADLLSDQVVDESVRELVAAASARQLGSGATESERSTARHVRLRTSHMHALTASAPAGRLEQGDAARLARALFADSLSASSSIHDEASERPPLTSNLKALNSGNSRMDESMERDASVPEHGRADEEERDDGHEGEDDEEDEDADEDGEDDDGDDDDEYGEYEDDVEDEENGHGDRMEERFALQGLDRDEIEMIRNAVFSESMALHTSHDSGGALMTDVEAELELVFEMVNSGTMARVDAQAVLDQVEQRVLQELERDRDRERERTYTHAGSGGEVRDRSEARWQLQDLSDAEIGNSENTFAARQRNEASWNDLRHRLEISNVSAPGGVAPNSAFARTDASVGRILPVEISEPDMHLAPSSSTALSLSSGGGLVSVEPHGDDAREDGANDDNLEGNDGYEEDDHGTRYEQQSLDAGERESVFSERTSVAANMSTASSGVHRFAAMSVVATASASEYNDNDGDADVDGCSLDDERFRGSFSCGDSESQSQISTEELLERVSLEERLLFRMFDSEHQLMRYQQQRGQNRRPPAGTGMTSGTNANANANANAGFASTLFGASGSAANGNVFNHALPSANNHETASNASSASSKAGRARRIVRPDSESAERPQQNSGKPERPSSSAHDSSRRRGAQMRSPHESAPGSSASHARMGERGHAGASSSGGGIGATTTMLQTTDRALGHAAVGDSGSEASYKWNHSRSQNVNDDEPQNLQRVAGSTGTSLGIDHTTITGASANIRSQAGNEGTRTNGTSHLGTRSGNISARTTKEGAQTAATAPVAPKGQLRRIFVRNLLRSSLAVDLASVALDDDLPVASTPSKTRSKKSASPRKHGFNNSNHKKDLPM
ncbi:hypothetical protein FVE85_6907 [Porphyridium purpureum]|uniref:Uncharacterized protein n=1 Tax=Porphyridium purpureum TaxID=35688 RepID=A0A5J4Z8E3_PORPP|nr:hypothetical protein FVE85_6907 [Porphyridium purpureum]|eukprot:POR5700..scf295_1